MEMMKKLLADAEKPIVSADDWQKPKGEPPKKNKGSLDASDSDDEDKNAKKPAAPVGAKKKQGGAAAAMKMKRAPPLCADSDSDNDSDNEVEVEDEEEPAAYAQCPNCPNCISFHIMRHLIQVATHPMFAETREKVLVFSQWTSMLDIIQAHICHKFTGAGVGMAVEPLGYLPPDLLRHDADEAEAGAGAGAEVPSAIIVMCDMTPLQHALYASALELPDFDNVRNYHGRGGK